MVVPITMFSCTCTLSLGPRRVQYNEKRSIITLKPFHCDLGSYLLYSLSAGQKIIFTCIQKFCSPQAGHALSALQVAFMAVCTSPYLNSFGRPVYLVTERKSSCVEQLFNM